MIKLYFLNINTIASNEAHFLSLLSESRSKKALSYKIKNDMLRFTAGSILIKTIFGTDNISYSHNGKPYIPDASEFNLSHDGEWAVLALSDVSVGVDIESIDKTYDMLQKLINSRVFSDAERSFICKYHDIDAFYTIWTMKESLFKCDGAGTIANCVFSSDGKFLTGKPFSSYRISICTKALQTEIYSYILEFEDDFSPKLIPINIDLTEPRLT